MRKEQGFTIIELMLVIVVVGVLMALALPSFNRMMLNTRSQAQGEELAVAINYARSEAVKRGARVSICASNVAGTACGGDWTNGLLVFVDDALSDAAAAVTVGDVLKHWEPFGDGAVITANNGAINFARFSSSGMLARVPSANTVPVVFRSHIDGCDGPKMQNVTIGVAGMIDVARVACPAS